VHLAGGGGAHRAEDARADDRADREEDEVPRAEGALHLPLALVAFRGEVGDRLATEELEHGAEHRGAALEREGPR
jgi:hypothetical protein